MVQAVQLSNEIMIEADKYASVYTRSVSMQIEHWARISKIAEEIGRPMAQLALNWLRQKPEVTSIIAGASSVRQLDSNVAACDWDIDDESMKKLNEIVEPFK